MEDLALRAENSTAVSGTTASAVPRPSTLPLIAAGSVGAAIALSLGLYGRFHTATGLTIDPVRPQDLLMVKSVLTTVGAGLVLFQLLSAWWLYGGRPFAAGAPSWIGPAHRWSGTTAFVATLPAAYHCLWALGFRDTSTRVLIHSLVGCAFYGAFATKLLVLRSNRMPGWALPVVGATAVTLMVAIWFSSALWYFTGSL